MATFYQSSDLFYEFSIKIKDSSLTSMEIELIEFTIGSIKKIYPSDEVKYLSNGVYSIRFTQEETAKFLTGEVATQARVKFSSGNVIPTNIVTADVKHSLSKAVL